MFKDGTQYVQGYKFFDGVKNDIANLENSENKDVLIMVAEKYDAILHNEELEKEIFLAFGRCKTICLKALMGEMSLSYEVLKKFYSKEKLNSLKNYCDITEDFLELLHAMLAFEETII